MIFIAVLSLVAIFFLTEQLVLRHVPNKRTEDLLSEKLFFNRSLELEAEEREAFSDIIEPEALRAVSIKRIFAGSREKCGNEPNKFVELQNGKFACLKFGARKIRGELFAFYLARILGLSNVPSVALTEFEGRLAIAIQWIPNLTKVTLPKPIQMALKQEEKSASLTADSVQYSDMAIFDFLSGNFDRVVGVLDAFRKTGNGNLLAEILPNSARAKDTNSIWLLDNEKSFNGEYLFPEALSFEALKALTMCKFRRETLLRLKALKATKDPRDLLIKVAKNSEDSRLWKRLEPNLIFEFDFMKRIQDLWTFVQQCQN